MCARYSCRGRINQPKYHCPLGTGSVPLDRLEAKSIGQGYARDFVPVGPEKPHSPGVGENSEARGSYNLSSSINCNARVRASRTFRRFGSSRSCMGNRSNQR